MVDDLYVFESMVFLHRDKRRNVSSANRTGLLSLDELLPTVFTDTEVTARHYKSVLGVRQANQALGVRVVIFNRLLSIFSVVVIPSHAVNRFQLERETIDEGDLLRHVDPVDVLVTILGEGAIGHHGVLGPVVLIVDRDDHRMVVLDALAELERC